MDYSSIRTHLTIGTYEQWSIEVTLHQKGKGFENVLEHETAPRIASESKQLFEKHQRYAKELFYATIDSEILFQIKDLETPYEIWENLKIKFLSPSLEKFLYDMLNFLKCSN